MSNVAVRTISLPKNMANKVDEIATANHMKRSTVISLAVEQWLASRKGKEAITLGGASAEFDPNHVSQPLQPVTKVD